MFAARAGPREHFAREILAACFGLTLDREVFRWRQASFRDRGQACGPQPTPQKNRDEALAPSRLLSYSEPNAFLQPLADDQLQQDRKSVV